MKYLIILLLFITSLNGSASSFDSSLTPPGTIIAYGGFSCPPGYLGANGTSVERAGKYARLFSVIGTAYGAADGAHFSMPNTQGVFLRGNGSQNIGGNNYSASIATIQADSLQGHFHSVNDPGHIHTATTNATAVIENGGPVARDDGSEYSLNGSSVTVNSNTTGLTARGVTTDGSFTTARVSAETRPANITINYCIKY